MPSVAQLSEADVPPDYEQSQIESKAQPRRQEKDYFNRKRINKPNTDGGPLILREDRHSHLFPIPGENFLTLNHRERTQVPSPRVKNVAVEAPEAARIHPTMVRNPAKPSSKPLNPTAPPFVPRPDNTQLPSMTSSRFTMAELPAWAGPFQSYRDYRAATGLSGMVLTSSYNQPHARESFHQVLPKDQE